MLLGSPPDMVHGAPPRRPVRPPTFIGPLPHTLVLYRFSLKRQEEIAIISAKEQKREGARHMEIRKGREEDLPRIGWLYSQARRAMGEAGIDQWQNGDYPNETDARKDMDQGPVLRAGRRGRGHRRGLPGLWPRAHLRRDRGGGLGAGTTRSTGSSTASPWPRRPRAGERQGLLFEELKRQARDRGRGGDPGGHPP